MQVTPVAVDVTTEAGRKQVLAACPEPDIVVNNAGGPPPGDFRSWGREDWLKAIDANMLTPIEFGADFEPVPGAPAPLDPVGPILGSSVVTLTETATGRTIVFSGDLGRGNHPLLAPPADAAPMAAWRIGMSSTSGTHICAPSNTATTCTYQVRALIGVSASGPSTSWPLRASDGSSTVRRCRVLAVLRVSRCPASRFRSMAT